MTKRKLDNIEYNNSKYWRPWHDEEQETMQQELFYNQLFEMLDGQTYDINNFNESIEQYENLHNFVQQTDMHTRLQK